MRILSFLIARLRGANSDDLGDLNGFVSNPGLTLRILLSTSLNNGSSPLPNGILADGGFGPCWVHRKQAYLAMQHSSEFVCIWLLVIVPTRNFIGVSSL